MNTYGLMTNEVTIYFDDPIPFKSSNIKLLNGIAGLYFIFSKSIDINYPFDKSKLLYIGMSEKKPIVLVVDSLVIMMVNLRM